VKPCGPVSFLHAPNSYAVTNITAKQSHSIALPNFVRRCALDTRKQTVLGLLCLRAVFKARFVCAYRCGLFLCSILGLMKLLLPTISSLSPERAVFPSDCLPLKLAALFHLSNDTCRPDRKRPPQSRRPRPGEIKRPVSPSLKTLGRDHPSLVADYVHARANQGHPVELLGVLQISHCY
jgi:hypothetical protein